MIMSWAAASGFPAGTIEFDVISFGRNRNESKSQNISKSGATETNFLYEVDEFQITTAPLSGADIDDFKDFIGATRSGENYAFTDPDNELITHNVLTVGSVQTQRYIPSGIDYYTYTFVARSIV